MNTVFRHFGLTLAALTLAACGSTPTTTGQPHPKPMPDSASAAPLTEASTSLEVTKTAVGYREMRARPAWTLDKSATPNKLHLAPGESGTVQYTLSYTKMDGELYEVTGVRGEVCVKNVSQVATRDLKIKDVVQKTFDGADSWWDYSGVYTYVDTSTNPVLDSGERHCYAYDMPFEPVNEPGKTFRYRNTVQVTSHTHEGVAGLNVAEPFTIPAEVQQQSAKITPSHYYPPITPVIEDAGLEDTLYCPQGFSCTPIEDSYNNWGRLTGSGHVTYTVKVTNVDAACDASVGMENTAVLTPSNGAPVEAHAVVLLTTPACPEPVPADPGCTLTQGYWKTHSKEGPAPYDSTWALIGAAGEDTQFYLSEQSYYEVITTPARGNPYYILARQFIAAQLNVLNGADDSDITQALSEAQAFFSKTTPEEALSLTGEARSKIIALAEALTAYNEGTTGPGHCDDK